MVKLKKPKSEPKVSAGSMADIAFLLLIFFLVSTTLMQDKGLMIQLPPNLPPQDTQVKSRNLFKININSKNQYLIEGEVKQDLSGLVDEIKEFILNPKSNPSLAKSPKDAIISIKAQRGAKYVHFIKILDMIKEAYYQLYGDRIGLTSDEFRKLNQDDPNDNKLYLAARKDLPMNISIAEPDKLK